MWPRGYSADFDPLMLFDAGRNVVARGGEVVSMAGGYTGDTLEQCRGLDVFLGSRPRVVTSQLRDARRSSASRRR